MAASNQSILLLGAGTLGLPILLALATCSQRGATEITLATRNPQASSLAPILKEHGIKPLSLDIAMSTQEELSGVFSRYSTVISCSGMGLPPGTQLKLARAALASDAHRFFPWQFGVDYDAMAGSSKQDLFTEQLQVRQELRSQQRTHWVVLSTGVFADFLISTAAGFGVIEHDSKDGMIVRALGSWNNKVTSTKVEDIAAVVTRLIYDHRHVEGVVFIAGQTVSYKDVLNAVKHAMGEVSVRAEEWTVDYLEAELNKDPDNGMKKYRAAFAEGTGVFWDENETWNRKQELQLTRIDDWIKEYLLEASTKTL